MLKTVYLVRDGSGIPLSTFTTEADAHKSVALSYSNHVIQPERRGSAWFSGNLKVADVLNLNLFDAPEHL